MIHERIFLPIFLEVAEIFEAIYMTKELGLLPLSTKMMPVVSHDNVIFFHLCYHPKDMYLQIIQHMKHTVVIWVASRLLSLRVMSKDEKLTKIVQNFVWTFLIYFSFFFNAAEKSYSSSKLQFWTYFNTYI